MQFIQLQCKVPSSKCHIARLVLCYTYQKYYILREPLIVYQLQDN